MPACPLGEAAVPPTLGQGCGQERGRGGRTLRACGGALAWVCHSMVAVLIAVAVLAGAGLAGLSWRLAQGPLDVGWALRWIVAAANPPGAPTRIAIGGAAIKWQGFDEGADHALDLQLREVRVVDAGRPVAELALADMALSPAALLRGELVPRRIELDGLQLRLVRNFDGGVSVDIGSLADGAADGGASPSIAETMAALTSPAQTDRGGDAVPGLRHIEQLRSVRIRNAAVAVVDRQLGATFGVSEIALNLRRQPSGGVVGGGTAALTAGAATARLTLRAELAENGTQVAASLTPVSLAALADALPALAPAAHVEAAVELSAVAALSATLAPRSLAVHAAAGGGRAQLPAAELKFESLALDASGSWDAAGPAGASPWRLPDRMALSRLQVVVASPAGGWNTTLGATGQATRRADRLHADLALTVDHMAFADLPRLWPAAWGGHVRPWIVENVTAGTARAGQVTLGLDADLSKPGTLSKVAVAAAGGTLQGDDVTIHWLRPVPPIEHAQAVLTIRGADVIEIAVPSARQGTAQLSNGVVRINGLSVKDQFLALNADVAASVPELLTLLRHPRLHLLDRHPVPIRNPAGTVAGKLGVNLPLQEHLDFSDVAIHASGQLSGLRLGGLVAGRDLDRGEMAVDVTAEALKASGRAAVGGIPAALTVDMDFKPGPPSQVVQRATATGAATARQLAAAGLDPSPVVGPGAVNFTAAYQARRDGQGEVRVQADLQDAALALAGWKKPPGQPASASARLVLGNDRLQGVSDLQAQGPGMQVRGRLDMAGDKPALLALDPIVLGATQAHGEIRLPATPNEPVRATLAGTVLDLSSGLSHKPAQGAAATEGAAKDSTAKDGAPWVADVSFDQVLLAEGRSMAGLTAHAEYDGQRLRTLQARSVGAERLQATIRPQGNGRQLSVRAADGGALLRALGVLQTVDGGTLAVDGHYDDSARVSVLTGTADLRQFHVRDAPVVGKLLQALTVYGIGDAVSGPGLAFSQANSPFRWDGDVLEVLEAQAFSASLGLTAHGRIDTARKVLDLKGTIVPAYALNSALGRIPLLGGLFSAERGGGLFAVDYSVSGALDSPAVAVNPLSALTPGFLRRLFRIFD